MTQSKVHAGHDASHGTLSSVLMWKQSIDEGNDRGRPEAHDAGQESSLGVNVGPFPGEWARVSQLAIKHLNRSVSLEPKVLRCDDPNAIHDLRVATRRLQQVLDLLYPSPRSGEIRKLYRGLKRCRRSLSEIRNYDVLLDRVDKALARKRIARREAWEEIRVYLKESRTAKLERALRKFAKTNLSTIYVRLKEHLAAGEYSHQVIETSTHDSRQDLKVEEFYARIGEGLKSAWAAFEEEIAQSRQEPDPTVLHCTRVAAKRVRYLIEIIYAFDVPGSKEALVWLRSLQTQLGNWHDLVVFEEAVIEMLADRAFLGNHLEMAVQIERLIMKNRAQKAKLENKYFEMTRDKTGFFKTREWVRRMADSPSALLAEAG